jgi:hypothetical protein
VRYDLQQHVSLRNTLLARDTVYGLFTFIFLLLVLRSFIESSEYLDCPRLIVNMEDDVRQYIIRSIQDKPAGSLSPPLRSVLDSLRNTPTRALSQETNDGLANISPAEKTASMQRLMGYLDKLDQRYGHLEGIKLAREY